MDGSLRRVTPANSSSPYNVPVRANTAVHRCYYECEHRFAFLEQHVIGLTSELSPLLVTIRSASLKRFVASIRQVHARRFLFGMCADVGLISSLAFNEMTPPVRSVSSIVYTIAE